MNNTGPRKSGVGSQFGGWPIRENEDGSRQRFVGGKWIPLPAVWAQSGKRPPSERQRGQAVTRFGIMNND